MLHGSILCDFENKHFSLLMKNRDEEIEHILVF